MGVQPCPDSVSPAPQTPWILAISSHMFSFTSPSLIQLFDHLFNIPSSPGFVPSLVPGTKDSELARPRHSPHTA